MRERRAGTVTFVFTDIEGSTTLVRRLRERWPEVHSAHRRIVRQAFASNGGDEVDTQGDSFFYVFGRARDAALAAADAQRGLAANEWPDDADVRIRIGMHTGEPVVSEEGYHGIGVHRAARIMAAAHGGQVLLSEATVAVLRDEEVAGVGVRDLGVHRLKDLDRPEHVYQLVADGLASSFPKIRTVGEEKAFYRRPLVIGAAAGVLAAAVAIPVFALGESGSTVEALSGNVDDNAVGVVDAASGTLTAQATGVDDPQRVATGAGATWVTSGDKSLAKIDPGTHELEQTIDVGNGPLGVAVNGRDVWVANSLDGTVSRVSADTNHEVDHYTVGNTPAGVAVAGGSIWVTNAGDGTLTQLDARTGALKRTVDLDSPVGGIAYGGGSLWVTDPVGNAVIRVRVASPSATTRIDVGSGPSAIAYGAGRVWVANNLAGTVSRIDPSRNIQDGTFPVGAAPNGVAVTPTAVWVSDEVDGTLVHVDPKSGVAEPTRVGGRPEGVAVENGSVWVAVQAAGDAHRGGDLRIVLPFVDSVDPAIAYYPGTWDVIAVVNDGLVGFKRVGGVDGNSLVPDLAASLPRPTDGGRTYSFQLRAGIRFSNGKEVTPNDVLATFERLFRAYTVDQEGKRQPSPRLDYYSGIVGAQACLARPSSCDLSRGIATNNADRTVTFHLTAPDPEFLYKLAIPFASVVPDGTSPRDHAVAGTGPYMVDVYKPQRYVHLVRNPRFHVWSRAAQPAGLPDTIDLSTTLTKGRGKPLTPQEAFLAAAAGRIDIPEAGVPPDLLATARTQYPTQLHITPGPQTNWLLLNTHKRPFSNVHARRALAYALDRGQMVVNAGGSDLAALTCQLLPPGLPGYKPYCPFTAGPQTGKWTAPDLGRARAEVTRSGTRGERVALITTLQTPGFGRNNLVAAATLRRLGYRVSVKYYKTDRAYFQAQGADSRHIDATVNGWSQDYPAPASFLQGINCPISPFNCDPVYSRRIAAAAATAASTGSNDSWTTLDRIATLDAAAIPFMNPKTTAFVSKRVGNYQHHPEFDLMLSQLWVR
jgi:ABC-type transport system substrate-binding protein/class 3 adenylate cyclase